jgi:hypothetical protein
LAASGERGQLREPSDDKTIFFLPPGRVTGGVCLLIGLFAAFMMAFVAVTEKGKSFAKLRSAVSVEQTW